MSKDPAFLFYPNDYIGGTMGMTFEEKGAYIELLMLQFNRGHMTSQVIGQVIGQLWVKLQDKFKIDEKGLYYNERLDLEIEKRKTFVQSRFNNLLGKNQYTKKEAHKTNHMTSHMENENENVIVNRNRNNKGAKNKKLIIPTIEEVKQYFKEAGYSEESAITAFDYYTDLDWHDKNDNPVLNWKMKMRTVWFKDEHKLQEQTDYSPLNDILKTLKQ